MIPMAFDYVRPSTVDEAVAALVAAGEDGKVISGGQSLMPVLRLRMADPSELAGLLDAAAYEAFLAEEGAH